jgi:short-subunit dehydrogenase
MKVLITGATSGIGLALAEFYHSRHHQVVAVGRNIEVLKQLHSLGCDTWQLDLIDLEACRQTFGLIANKHEFIDLAILNAGSCEYLDTTNFDAQLVKRVFAANIFTLANSIEGVLPMLRKASKPHLSAVASIAGYLPLSRAEAYGASKAAANYFLESLAIDLKSEGIIVTTINPGFVKTPLTAKNDFPMPFALEASQAAQIIYSGLMAKKIEIHFPWQLTLSIKMLSLLPKRLLRVIGQWFKK